MSGTKTIHKIVETVNKCVIISEDNSQSSPLSTITESGQILV